VSSSTHSTFIANPISTSIEVTTTTLSTITTTNKCVSTTAKSIIPSTYDTNSCPSNRVYQPSFLTTKNSYSHGYPILQAIICFGGSLDLKCPTSSYLNIYSAYYGIQHDTTTYCTRNSNTKSPSICYSSSSYDTIKYLCQEKNNCKVGATSFYFTDRKLIQLLLNI
jgi:hypothetical protein